MSPTRQRLPSSAALLRTPRLFAQAHWLLSALALGVSWSQPCSAQTSWRVQTISTTAGEAFTDGRTVVWSDGISAYKWTDGVQATLAPNGRWPVVDGNRSAWIASGGLFYDDGTGPQVVFTKQADSDPLPRIAGAAYRPSLTGEQLAFTYVLVGGVNSSINWGYNQVGVYESGSTTYPVNPPFDINTYGGSLFSSTNGRRVVWTTDYQTGQQQVFQWVDSARSAISPLLGGPGFQQATAITTDDYAFYTSPVSDSSSNLVRYSFATQTSEVIAQCSNVDAYQTWASKNRAVFTGTAGDLVLWSSGTSTSLAPLAYAANVSAQNVAWFDPNTLTVRLYDGSMTHVFGPYAVRPDGLSVSDSIVAWVVNNELFVAIPVPEPSTLAMCLGGAASVILMASRRRKKRQTV